MRLLLVDDEQVLLIALSRILEGAGYEVTAVSSGEKALSALQEDGLNPDLIITDVLMDKVSGVDLFNIVRATPATQGIPFIFVSASAKPDLEAVIANSPNALFMRKPFEVEALLAQIERVLGQTAA